MSVVITAEQINTVFDDMNAIKEDTRSNSSFTDYLLINSATASQSMGQEVLKELGSDAYHPEFAYSNYTAKQQEYLNFEDEVFKEFYDKQDGATKKEMLDTDSNAEAYIVAYKRQAQEEAMDNVSEDGITTQIGMSLLPAMINPSMILPAALVGGTLFKATTTASRILGGVASGAIGGAVANTIDETQFEAQGMHYSYPNAALYGATFGGVLGGASGTIASLFLPHNNPPSNPKRNAEITLSTAQPGQATVHIGPEEFGARGQDVAPINHIMDKIMGWWTDDIHIGFGSMSQTVRNTTAKLADASVALKNTAGEWLPLGKTVQSIRRNNMKFYSKLDEDVGIIHSEHTSDGSRVKLTEEASAGYHTMENRQEIDAYNEGIRKEAEAKRRGIVDEKELAIIRKEAREEFYARPIDWDGLHMSEGATKVAMRYSKYYEDVSTNGARLDIKKLAKHPKGKLYKPRLLNPEKYDFKTNPQMFMAVEKAFANHPGNSKMTPDEILEITKAYVDFVMDSEFKKNFSHNSFTMPSSTELPGSPRLKGRKFRMDTRELTAYMKTDLQDLTSAYNYQMVGNHALQEVFGTSNFHKIMDEIRVAMRLEGDVATPKEIAALERVFRDLAGDLRMNPLSNTPGWTATRSATAMNSIRFGGKFGYVNQVVELAANMSMNGFTHMVKAGWFDGFKAASKLLYKANGLPDDDLARMVVNMGFFEDAHSVHQMNRAADSDIGFNSGILEKGLFKASSTFMKYNGLRLVKSIQEYVVAGALMREIPKMAQHIRNGTMSEANMARITAWGLNPDELILVADNLNTHFESNKKLHLDRFDPEAVDLLQLAVTKNMERSVLQGDSIYVPSRSLFNFKDANMAQKLVFQFMRFPAMAHNTFLRRGLTQDRARMAGGVLGSVLAYSGWLQLEEQAKVALGLMYEHERKYNLDTAEGAYNSLAKSINYVGAFGMLTTGWNYGATLTGNPELGTDYASRPGVTNLFGPTAGWADDAITLVASQFGQTEMTDEQQAIMLKDITIGKTIPIMNNGIDAMIEDYL